MNAEIESTPVPTPENTTPTPAAQSAQQASPAASNAATKSGNAAFSTAGAAAKPASAPVASKTTAPKKPSAATPKAAKEVTKSVVQANVAATPSKPDAKATAASATPKATPAASATTRSRAPRAASTAATKTSRQAAKPAGASVAPEQAAQSSQPAVIEGSQIPARAPRTMPTARANPSSAQTPVAAALPQLIIFSPAGVLPQPQVVDKAARRLGKMGFDVLLAPHAKSQHQRFSGNDDERLHDIHATARACPDIALASRGGYGMTRLLDRIDWKLVAASVDAGVRWVGHSDFTAFQLALYAHTKRSSWSGPMAAYDFGRKKRDIDDITSDCFVEAMTDQLEALGFKTDKGFDGLQTSGILWGGNLSVVCALLGTAHWPKIKGGILFLEDVAEHPYRIERMLLQLHQAGVLAQQKAIVLGDFSDYKVSPLDNGYSLKDTIAYIRSLVDIPVLTGLPVGHTDLKVTLPVGRSVRLVVEQREALISWGD